MEKIKYSVELKLLPPFVSSGSEKCCGNKLFPFSRIQIRINEHYLCPFCGEETNDFSCCKTFKNEFKKLQKSFNADNYESKLHVDAFENLGYERQVSDLQFKKLTAKEISELDPNIWDNAHNFSDRFTDCSYFVSNVHYDGSKVEFLCKNLQSKAIYHCELRDINHKNVKIYLGCYREKTVSHGEKKLGNYHFESYWENVAEFEDWNAFCENLISQW